MTETKHLTLDFSEFDEKKINIKEFSETIQSLSNTKDIGELMNVCEKRLDELYQNELETKIKGVLINKYSDIDDLSIFSNKFKISSYKTYKNNIKGIYGCTFLITLCKNKEKCDASCMHLILQCTFTRSRTTEIRWFTLYCNYYITNDPSSAYYAYPCGSDCDIDENMKKQLHIHGTTHVLDESVNEIMDKFGFLKSDVIFKKRKFFGLVSKNKNKLKLFLTDILQMVKMRE